MQDEPVDVDNLIKQNKQLRRANTKKVKQLKYERRRNEELRKLLNPDGKKHYRNARKKGRTLNG